MQKAIEVSESMKRAGALFTRGIDRKTSQPPFQTRIKQEQRDLANYYGEPTEVKAITNEFPKPYVKKVSQEEIEERRANNQCFKCRATGHGAQECRTGWKSGKSSAKKAPQKAAPKQQKKKFNPLQLRHHIRSLIDESFAEGSEEYNTFVQEVEDLGF